MAPGGAAIMGATRSGCVGTREETRGVLATLPQVIERGDLIVTEETFTENRASLQATGFKDREI